MSIKIKVSYQDPDELQELVKKLQGYYVRVRKPKEQKGRYKRAYIDLRIKGPDD